MALPKYSVLQIRPAKDSLTGQAAFIEFLASIKSSLKAKFFDRLLNSFETITLEIANLNQTTFFIIACPEHLEHLVISQIAAQYPTALITPMKDYLSEWLGHGEASFGELTLSGPSFLSINSTLDDKVDQMASILGSLARTPAGQAAIVQICLFAAPKNWQKSVRSHLETVTPASGTDPAKSKPSPYKAIIEKKLLYQAFGCDIRLAAIATNHQTSSQLLSQLAAAFGTYSLSEGNSFALKKLKFQSSIAKLRQMVLTRSVKYANQYQYLNYGEIAAIFHLPGILLTPIKGIAWGKTLKGEAPTNLPVDENIQESERHLYNFFAKTEYKNHLAIFGMKKGIDRLRHTYILGKSGTGKSTLIGRMAINDIQHGEGVAFVDPHGDAAEVLLDYIPESRIDDVAYLDPSIPGISFWMNPLYVKNPAQGEMVASSIVSIFSKLYGNSWGPRLEYILRNTLLTLVYKPETTLADVPRILTNKDFREKECLVHVTDPILVNFWRDEYDKYSEKFQTEAIAPILNKVGQFVTSPTIRDIINHPKSTVDFEDMMNSGKIIILNLPQGKIGEDNAALLGAMFISQIQIAAMNRAHVSEESRRDFFLYVDEFQNFATSSFVKILSEARKYKLGLILANQYIAQLPEEIQNAIFGNVGTVMSYVVGAQDADRIMKELNNLYTADDLVGLGKYQLAMKMSVDSQMTQPFSSYGLPLPDTRTHQKEKVLEATYKKYYRKIEPMDMSQVTSIMTPAAKRFTEPPYIPLAQRTPAYGSSPNSYPTPPQKPPYQPQQTISRSTPPFVQTSPVSVTAANATQPPLTSYPKRNSQPSDPSLGDLDNDRKEGLRPSVVGCFLNSGKILFVYQKIHQLWQLPQGGVDNKETLTEAFKREMIEELGSDFVKQTSFKPTFLSVDKIEFPPDKQGLRELKLDAGEPITMKGKKYYFLYATSSSTNLKFPTNEEYNDFKWVDYDEAKKLAETSAQGGKLRITTAVLENLKTKDLLKTGTIVNNQINKNGPKPTPRPESQPRTSNPIRRNNPSNLTNKPGSNLHSPSSLEVRPDSTITIRDTNPNLPAPVDKPGAGLPGVDAPAKSNPDSADITSIPGGPLVI